MKAIFLVANVTPVYYLRVEPGHYDNPGDTPGFCDDGNRDQYRAQYLAGLMASSSPQINLDSYPYETVVWKDDTGYRQQVLAIVKAQRTLFRRAIARLEDSDRAIKSAPLPAFPEQDGSVLVQTGFSKPLD